MNSKVILLVDDNPGDVELTKLALRREHITNEVVVAEDGQEALDYMFGNGAYEGRDISEMPAIILLDLNLPVIDGIEVLRSLRAAERTRRQLIIVLSSSKEEKDLISCYNLGVNSYIRKPVDFIQFVYAIKHLGLYWLDINESPPETNN